MKSPFPRNVTVAFLQGQMTGIGMKSENELHSRRLLKPYIQPNSPIFDIVKEVKDIEALWDSGDFLHLKQILEGISTGLQVLPKPPPDPALEGLTTSEQLKHLLRPPLPDVGPSEQSGAWINLNDPGLEGLTISELVERVLQLPLPDVDAPAPPDPTAAGINLHHDNEEEGETPRSPRQARVASDTDEPAFIQLGLYLLKYGAVDRLGHVLADTEAERPVQVDKPTQDLAFEILHFLRLCFRNLVSTELDYDMVKQVRRIDRALNRANQLDCMIRFQRVEDDHYDLAVSIIKALEENELPTRRKYWFEKILLSAHKRNSALSPHPVAHTSSPDPFEPLLSPLQDRHYYQTESISQSLERLNLVDTDLSRYLATINLQESESDSDG